MLAAVPARERDWVLCQLRLKEQRAEGHRLRAARADADGHIALTALYAGAAAGLYAEALALRARLGLGELDDYMI